MGIRRTTRNGWAATALVGLIAAVLVTLAGPATGSAGADPLCITKPSVVSNPTKILTIGDSLTSAASGDYTWRYFLWKHLVTNGGATPAPTTTSYQFVGPYSDLVDPVALTRDSDTYRCSFDKANGAWPGTFLARYVTSDSGATGPELIGPMITGSGASVLVVFAGANDLTRVHAGSVKDTPTQVLANAHQLVLDARAAQPSIKIVFLTVPTKPGAPADEANQRSYNSMLTTAVPTWSTVASPVALATTATNWSGPDLTYDKIHPNPPGEVTIAADVADALHSIGVGPAAARPLPDLSSYIGPRDPAVLAQPTITAGGVSLSWTLPLGSVQSKVQRFDFSNSNGWQTLGVPITLASTDTKPYTSTYNDSSYVGGHRYQYRILSGKGTTATSGTWQYPVSLTSNVVTVPTPDQVVGLSANPTVHGLALAWTAAPAATSYKVVWHPAGSSATSERTTNSTSLQLTGLVAGQSYGVKVIGLNAQTPGPPSAEVVRTPLGNKMATPAKPALKALSKHRIKVSFALIHGATKYLIQLKAPGGSWRTVGTVAKGPFTTKSLSKGKTYSVRIRPYDSYAAGTYSPAAKIRTT